MDDGIQAQGPHWIWIHWADRIVSFHPEDGYERLEFPSGRELMDYVFEKTSNGFRIQ